MKLPVLKSSIQVRYSDTDALGHIAYESYVTFMQVGRLGVFEEIAKLTGWQEPVVVAHIDLDFIQECFYGDEISVTTWCSHVGNKSMTLSGEIHANGKLVARGSTVHVGFDAETRKSKALPSEWEVSDYSAAGS